MAAGPPPRPPEARARGAKGGRRAHCACVRPRPRDQGVPITWSPASQSARLGGASWPRSRAGRGRLPAIKPRRASAARWGSPGGPRFSWAGGPLARQVGTGPVSPRLAPPLGTGPSARQGVPGRSAASATPEGPRATFRGPAFAPPRLPRPAVGPGASPARASLSAALGAPAAAGRATCLWQCPRPGPRRPRAPWWSLPGRTLVLQPAWPRPRLALPRSCSLSAARSRAQLPASLIFLAADISELCTLP